MTNKEAISIIEDGSEESTKIFEALDMAVKALGKQEPKKARIRGARVAIEFCPLCDERVNIGDNYCIHCGQRIEWSKEE